MPVIKRYSNRKLYNTTSKQYISLDDIAELVRSGEEVRIFDHNSGSDITTLVLFQVILEEEKRIGGLLPEIFLTRMIRSGAEALEHVKKIVSRSTDNTFSAVDWDNEIERRIQSLILAGKVSYDEGSRILDLLVTGSCKATDTDAMSASVQQPDATKSLIHEMLSQLDRLEAEVEELRQGRPHFND